MCGMHKEKMVTGRFFTMLFRYTEIKPQKQNHIAFTDIGEALTPPRTVSFANFLKQYQIVGLFHKLAAEMSVNRIFLR